MNKEQIQKKNISLDMDSGEFAILAACFGLVLEEMNDASVGKRAYLLYLKFQREGVEKLGWRLNDMMVAMNTQKE